MFLAARSFGRHSLVGPSCFVSSRDLAVVLQFKETCCLEVMNLGGETSRAPSARWSVITLARGAFRRTATRLRLLSPLFGTCVLVVISGTKLIRCSLCCLIQHFMLALEQQSGPIDSKAKLSFSPRVRDAQRIHMMVYRSCVWCPWTHGQFGGAHCGDTPAVLPSVKQRAELRYGLVSFATTQSGRDRSQEVVNGTRLALPLSH